MEVDVVSLASEFPNDNPALHRGAIWVCLEPTAPARPCRAEREADATVLKPPSEPAAEHAPVLEAPLAAEILVAESRASEAAVEREFTSLEAKGDDGGAGSIVDEPMSLLEASTDCDDACSAESAASSTLDAKADDGDVPPVESDAASMLEADAGYAAPAESDAASMLETDVGDAAPAESGVASTLEAGDDAPSAESGTASTLGAKVDVGGAPSMEGNAEPTLGAKVDVGGAPSTEGDVESIFGAKADGDDAPPTEIVPAAPPAATIDDAIPIIVVEATDAHDGEAEGAALSELEDEDGSAIVVEELDPVEVRLEGIDLSPAGEARHEIAPPTESSVVLAGERAAISEPPVSGVVLAEPEQLVDVAPAFESLPPDESAAARIDSSALPPAPDDPFTVLVCTLADVAIHAGAPRVAALLPGLLFDGRVPEPLDSDLADALREAGLWDGSEVAPSFVATTHAWRAILRGTSDDFSACGAAMLDEWASELLARLLCAPASAPTLRQELRTRGVAAFGLVEVAA